MRSGVWSAISSVTSKRSRSASTTSRTRTSGAEAPAVTPTVAGCPSQSQSMSLRPFDQPRRHADPLRDLGEPQRVAAVGRADHQHPVAFGSDRLDRRLAVRRGVANVLAARRADRRESAASRPRRSPRCRRPTSVVWVRKARLAAFGTATIGDVLDRFDERDRSGRNLAERADHFGMPGMADEQDVPAFLDQPLAPGDGPWTPAGRSRRHK